MSDRAGEVRISCPRDIGFIVWVDGNPIAAFTTRAELAQWVEDKLGAIPGEREREANDMAAAAEMAPNVEHMPSVMSRPRTEPRPRRGYFSRGG